ncbi:MAG: acetyl/propionyl/methylcrotonyl-CoA carboxylase subunit alpha [Parvularculaceae bacterium]
MFDKLLIANRGEIAVRIARTARRLGVATVAVHSEADAGAPHVEACDEAVSIGPPAPAESYLRIERIVQAARATGAEAIHPGYGFLSENAAFARALDEAGLVFVGPRAETIELMGSKSAAKDRMEAAGVPTTPGYQGADQSPTVFAREAGRVGYPVLLKATAGGSGKGMRMVAGAADLNDALASARREAASAFGDDRILIEKYVERARHVEVQIFGDGAGEVVHLFERDCSVQRRHQKIIEEAPAPRLPETARRKLLDAGVEAGRAVDYRGAGTVEFLYDGADGVYFMEMNTRLQVEHPVSEAITGVDLVEWQLRVAAGEPLPLRQEEIVACGPAFEARLYAENPDQNFAPAIGTLTTLRLPRETARVDSGVREGQDVTPYYDPMIAKIVTAGGSRAEALGRLRAALAETRVAGVEATQRFLSRLAADEDFADGDVSTRYIDDHPALFDAPAADDAFLAAALHWRLTERGLLSDDPWSALGGFRLNAAPSRHVWIALDGAAALARLTPAREGYDVTLEPNVSAAARRAGEAAGEPRRFSFSARALNDDAVAITVDGRARRAFVARHGAGARVWIDGAHTDFLFPDPLAGAAGDGAAEGSLVAPMPGVVTNLLVEPGARVESGATLLVMEAMKMEHAIKAPAAGVLSAFRFQPGQQVKEGDLLADFEETA